MASCLVAPLAGTVWKVEVKQGEAIAQGTVCVVLESMKMEIPLEAPTTTVVAQVLCAEGDVVQEGDPLVHFVS